MAFDPAPQIAGELGLPPPGVRAVLRLLEEGATVPFIARYRKEQTGALDEIAIRAIDEKRAYVSELEARRTAVRRSIEEQGKLTPEVARALEACTKKAELEDLYLPYKPKRKTRASQARERGLEPLAMRILAQPRDGAPKADAARFVSKDRGVADPEEALAGARDIVAEIVAERADSRAVARARFEREAVVTSRRAPAKTNEPTKFEAYYEFEERAKTIPSHRFLAIARGEEEGILRMRVRVDEEGLARDLLARSGRRRGSPYASSRRTSRTSSSRPRSVPTSSSAWTRGNARGASARS